MSNSVDVVSKKGKELTPLQKEFIKHLMSDAKGDLKLARQLSGYSENTTVWEIVAPIKDEVLEATKQVLAMHSIKAAFSLGDVLDTPSMLGASNAIKAATEVLDRVGVVKEDNRVSELPQGTIFILPPKDAKVSVNYSTDADMIDVTPSVVASTPNPAGSHDTDNEIKSDDVET